MFSQDFPFLRGFNLLKRYLFHTKCSERIAHFQTIFYTRLFRNLIGTCSNFLLALIIQKYTARVNLHSKGLAKQRRRWSKVVAIWTCVLQIWVGRPNRLASLLISVVHKLRRKVNEPRAIQLHRLALGGQTVKNLRANVIPTQVIAGHRKSTQVHASSAQTESQINISWRLACS